MPKKNKRQVRRDDSEPRQTAVDKVAVSAVAAPARSTEFKPDYTPVIRDLRRIGILAGSFIGILVILTFFLR